MNIEQSGKNNLNLQGGKTKRICQFCKIEFYKFPSAIGKFCSSKCYHNSRCGQLSWNSGLTKEIDERLKKISINNMGNIPWNKGIEYIQIKGDKNPSKRPEVREKLSGKNCHFYKHGHAYSPYCLKFNRSKKEEIREQYGRKCYICDKEEKDNILSNGKQEKLCVHHIDEDKEQGCNGKQWKLVPVCRKCHAKIHNKKEELI